MWSELENGFWARCEGDKGRKHPFEWFGFGGVGHWVVMATISGELLRNCGLERRVKWWPCNETAADGG